ncbi:MAG: hypothetical protein AAB855_00490 [Patescibacteria group bacterium]
MNIHALKIGAFLVLLYVLCLLWRFLLIDPTVMNFHLLALKSSFPGFQGYDAFSILWGGILSFAYGALGSALFHLLHNNCCMPRVRGEKKAKIAMPTSGIFWIAGTLVVGIAIGLLLGSRSAFPISAEYVARSASMMKDGGSAIVQFGDMMMNSGRMMQERGGRYNDQEMMEEGIKMMQNGEQFRGQGSTMMERGAGMMNMMR